MVVRKYLDDVLLGFSKEDQEQTVKIQEDVTHKFAHVFAHCPNRKPVTLTIRKDIIDIIKHSYKCK